MEGFLAILEKEVKHILRAKGVLKALFITPMVYLFVFASLQSTAENLPTAVLDYSNSQASAELIKALENSGTFRIRYIARNSQELQRYIKAGRILVGVEIPPDYAEKVTKRSGAFLALLDGSDPNNARQALNALRGIGIGIYDVEGTASGAASSANTILLYNPGERQAYMLIPGMIAFMLLVSGTNLTGLALARERERGTIEQLLSSPASNFAILLGKLCPHVALGMLQFLLVLMVSVFVMNFPFRGSVLSLFVLTLLYQMSLAATAFFIAGAARTQAEAATRIEMITLPSFLLSGYLFPLTSFPEPLQILARVLPITSYIEIVRGIMVRGASLSDFTGQTLLLFSVMSVLLLFGVLGMRRAGW